MKGNNTYETKGNFLFLLLGKKGIRYHAYNIYHNLI